MALPAELYDREYFLCDHCEGYDAFRSDRGLSLLKSRLVDELAPRPGMRVLDAGCGRGEVLRACALMGASVAGIDYSEAAVEISRDTLSDVAAVDIRLGTIEHLPWPDATFDRVLLGDVIEHLDSAQADAALAEILRVLEPGGVLVVHTSPNRLFLRLTWPLARRMLGPLGLPESADSLDRWITESKRYHVNEQTLRNLRRSLRRAGFSGVHAWIDPDVLRSGRHHLTRGLDRSRLTALAARVSSRRPLVLFVGNDLFARGIKPASSKRLPERPWRSPVLRPRLARRGPRSSSSALSLQGGRRPTGDGPSSVDA